MVKSYKGFSATGDALLTYDKHILPQRSEVFNLPEGTYTVELYYNAEAKPWGSAQLAVSAGGFYESSVSINASLSFR
jgi:hypothetical protein